VGRGDHGGEGEEGRRTCGVHARGAAAALYTHTHTHTERLTDAQTRTDTHRCVHTRMRVCVLGQVGRCMYIYACICIRVCVLCLCVCVGVCVCYAS
jgi:hypothetical protein